MLGFNCTFCFQEGETHAERLERLRRLSAPAQLSNISDSKRRRLVRRVKAEQRRKAAKQRPGKRQRAELKAQVFQHADGSPQGQVVKPKTESTAKKQSQEMVVKIHKQTKQSQKPSKIKKQRKV